MGPLQHICCPEERIYVGISCRQFELYELRAIFGSGVLSAAVSCLPVPCSRLKACFQERITANICICVRSAVSQTPLEVSLAVFCHPCVILVSV